MSKIEDGGPAFPVSEQRDPLTGYGIREGHEGMSLRDYFAAHAVGGAISSYHNKGALQIGGGTPQVAIAATAYQIADAMLAERAEAGAA